MERSSGVDLEATVGIDHKNGNLNPILRRKFDPVARVFCLVPTETVPNDYLRLNPHDRPKRQNSDRFTPSG